MDIGSVCFVCPKCSNFGSAKITHVLAEQPPQADSVEQVVGPTDLVSAELSVDLSRLVHDQCENVPHDIGLKLAKIVRQHFVTDLK